MQQNDLWMGFEITVLQLTLPWNKKKYVLLIFLSDHVDVTLLYALLCITNKGKLLRHNQFTTEEV